VSWFAPIGEAEGLDAVLEYVGKGYEPTWECEDVTNFLDSWLFVVAPEDGGKPAVLVLCVVDVGA